MQADVGQGRERHGVQIEILSEVAHGFAYEGDGAFLKNYLRRRTSSYGQSYAYGEG